MAHADVGHFGCPDQDDLSTGREDLGVLDTRQRLGGDAGAVEDYLGRGAEVANVDAGQLLPDAPHAVVISELGVEELGVLGRIDCQCSEGDSKLGTRGQLVGRDDFKLFAGQKIRGNGWGEMGTDILEVFRHVLDLVVRHLIIPVLRRRRTLHVRLL